MVAQLMHVVSVVAAHSSVTPRLGAIVAQQLAEVASVGQECLRKTDEDGLPAIRQGSGTDAGAVLESNIKALVAVAQDMRSSLLQAAALNEQGRLM